MTRPPAPTTGLRGHTHLVRVVVAVVLAGYGIALISTSAGHGYGPDEHLLAEQQKAIEAIEALSFGVDGGAYHPGETYRDERPTPPTTPPLTIALDKHVLVPSSSVPVPPGARALDDIGPAAALPSVVLPVEERPPKQSA